MAVSNAAQVAFNAEIRAALVDEIRFSVEIEGALCKSIPASMPADKAHKAVVNDNSYGALASIGTGNASGKGTTIHAVKYTGRRLRRRFHKSLRKKSPCSISSSADSDVRYVTLPISIPVDTAHRAGGFSASTDVAAIIFNKAVLDGNWRASSVLIPFIVFKFSLF